MAIYIVQMRNMVHHEIPEAIDLCGKTLRT